MTQRRYQRRPPSQYSEESVVIGFEDHVFEIKERLLTLNEPGCCVILIVRMAGSSKTTLAESIYNDNAVHFIPMLGFLYFLKSILLKIFCKTYGKK